jgi:hypothetical protein
VRQCAFVLPADSSRGDHERHHHPPPHLPAVRGLLRAGDQGPRQQVIGIRGHDADVFSAGYICPKGVALKDLHEDPDRLRAPLIKRNGEFVEVSPGTRPSPRSSGACRRCERMAAMRWPSRWATRRRTRSGCCLPFARLAKALGTRNVSSASTLDQMPKQLSSGLMFGHWLSVAVPDIAAPTTCWSCWAPTRSSATAACGPCPTSAARPRRCRPAVAAGGDRPAPHRDRRARRCPPLHPTPTPTSSCWRHGAHPVRRRAGDAWAAWRTM